MRRIAPVLFGAAFLLLVSELAVAQVMRNKWRDPEHLVIEGAEFFDATEVRDRLLADADVR
jgi:hypothetical protein